MSDYTRPHYTGHYSPFVDLFMFDITEDSSEVFEILLKDGSKHPKVRIPIKDYFPSEPYYFGGITMLGPKRSVAVNHYDFSKCYVGT